MIKDRIEKIIEEYNLTAAELADRLDVQRSSISHITSGRNKPSAQFIQNLLKEFSEINARWFITGEGEMLNSNAAQTYYSKEKEMPKQLSLLDETVKAPPKQQNPEVAQSVNLQEIEEKPKVQDKAVDKIIIFYNDKTFDTYSPRCRQ